MGEIQWVQGILEFLLLALRKSRLAFLDSLILQWSRPSYLPRSTPQLRLNLVLGMGATLPFHQYMWGDLFEFVGGRPLIHSTVLAKIRALSQRFGWRPVMEAVSTRLFRLSSKILTVWQPILECAAAGLRIRALTVRTTETRANAAPWHIIS